MVIYNVFTQLYFFLIRVLSPFNKKARLWVAGRKNWRHELSKLVDPNISYIWFHCASLGEFEQGRPLIEIIKQNHPKEKILLTFFSPSGYEVRKDYNQADIVIYLPQDGKKNAIDFLSLVKPKIAVFIKYEFWFNYLSELSRLKIPTFFVSTIFRDTQYFFKWYGSLGVKILKKIDFFFLQDQNSSNLLNRLNISNHIVSGDTRFDRVEKLKSNFKEIPLIKKFSLGSFTIVAGSSWPKDESLIIKFINEHLDKEIKWIIAPHNIDVDEIILLKNRINSPVELFSDLNEETVTNKKVILIDNIGMLSKLYYYCDIAYIGGGFGTGIHNILEATTYGKPVFFGPNFSNFNEAKELFRLGIAKVANDYESFNRIILGYYSDNQFLVEKGIAAKEFTLKNTGATNTIYDLLKKYLQN